MQTVEETRQHRRVIVVPEELARDIVIIPSEPGAMPWHVTDIELQPTADASAEDSIALYFERVVDPAA